MAEERWLTFTLTLTVGTMAFQGIGLNEEQRATMEGTVRAMIEEAQRAGSDAINRMGQQLQAVAAASSTQGRAPQTTATPWATNFLDMRPAKPETFSGKEAKWDGWYFKFNT